VAVDAQANQVVLGDREDLLAVGLEGDNANWLMDPPSGWLEGYIRIRYNHPGAAGRVRPDRDDPTRLTIRFDEPVAAVTPGQAAVLYVSGPAGWRVACGAWIRRSVKP
jgi:tRNA-uridine 2-sulfurtransferase